MWLRILFVYVLLAIATVEPDDVLSKVSEIARKYASSNEGEKHHHFVGYLRQTLKRKINSRNWFVVSYSGSTRGFDEHAIRVRNTATNWIRRWDRNFMIAAVPKHTLNGWQSRADFCVSNGMEPQQGGEGDCGKIVNYLDNCMSDYSPSIVACVHWGNGIEYSADTYENVKIRKIAACVNDGQIKIYDRSTDKCRNYDIIIVA